MIQTTRPGTALLPPVRTRSGVGGARSMRAGRDGINRKILVRMQWLKLLIAICVEAPPQAFCAGADAKS